MVSRYMCLSYPFLARVSATSYTLPPNMTASMLFSPAEIGITETPVIDRTTQTLYVVSVIDKQGILPTASRARPCYRGGKIRQSVGRCRNSAANVHSQRERLSYLPDAGRRWRRTQRNRSFALE